MSRLRVKVGVKVGVKIVEVGLRDGLQNEQQILPFQVRVEAAQKLISAGIQHLEVGSFVRADRVPQMADSSKVIEALLAWQTPRKILEKISALVPNERGMQDALQTGIKEIAIFTACSESFCQKNINCSIEESFQRFEAVLELAKKNKIKVRGYLSTCFGCPFEGLVSESTVVKLTKRLLDLGCFEVSIGDTIGVASPTQVTRLIKKLKKVAPIKKMAGHFHDTRGTALANIVAAYSLGMKTFDSSLGGLGGCPYAPVASGNVATEDLVYLFEKMGVHTGLDLPVLIGLNHWMGTKMNRILPSKVSQAGLPKISL